MVNAAYIKSRIDSIRSEIGRLVTVYTLKTSICAECVATDNYDPVTDTSFNYLCPLCQGTGWSSSVDSEEVLARVHWAGDERITATPGGKYYVGDCTLGVDPSYHELFQKAQSESGKIVVDGHDMQVVRIDPVGAPTINRYRIICTNMGTRPSA